MTERGGRTPSVVRLDPENWAGLRESCQAQDESVRLPNLSRYENTRTLTSPVVEPGDRRVVPRLPQQGVHFASVLKLFLDHVDQQDA